MDLSSYPLPSQSLELFFRTAVSVPFLWEESPGKPWTTHLTWDSNMSNISRKLDFPPRLQQSGRDQKGRIMDVGGRVDAYPLLSLLDIEGEAAYLMLPANSGWVVFLIYISTKAVAENLNVCCSSRFVILINFWTTMQSHDGIIVCREPSVDASSRRLHGRWSEKQRDDQFCEHARYSPRRLKLDTR